MGVKRESSCQIPSFPLHGVPRNRGTVFPWVIQERGHTGQGAGVKGGMRSGLKENKMTGNSLIYSDSRRDKCGLGQEDK